ncbi:MAG: ATP-binding protein [Vulcanimicrobiota bacterium]
MDVGVLGWSPPQGMLLLGALVLESLCVRLPGRGVYSAAYVPLLAAALSGPPAPAGLGLALTTSLRSLRCGWRQAAPEVLSLGAALLAAGLLIPRSRPIAAVCSTLIYWLLVGALSRRQAPADDRLAWLRMFAVVQEIRLLGLLFALGLALSAPDWHYLSLLWLPLLISHRAVAYSIFRLQSHEADQALQEMDRLQASLEQSQREQRSAAGRLVSSQEQRELLEELTSRLSRETNLASAAGQLFTVLRRSGGFTSLALLSKEAGAWSGLACQSPLAPRLEHHRLLNFQETWWDEAMRTNNPQILRTDSMDRIFAGEAAGLAIPLGPLLLYLGRPGPLFKQHECLSALWLVERAAPLLQTIAQRQSEQQALQQTRVESQQLQGQLTVLSGLLEAAALLASSIDYHGLGTLVEQACRQVFPQASGSLWLCPETPQQQWGDMPPTVPPSRLHQVVSSRRPWVQQGLVIQPLGGFGGALVLQFQGQGEDRQRLEQVGLLAYNVGLALSNARHLLEVVEAQAQVVQASKLAAVGQLAAGVAHELNSPLGAIAMSLSSLTPQISDEKTLRRLELASRSVDRCRSIVQRLFVFTRLGGAPSRALDLHKLVKESLDQLSGQDILLGAEIDYQGVSLQVKGHPQDLQELLSNLLVNALEAYPAEAGRKWLELRLTRQGNLAVLSLRDGGVGMTAEVLDRAFEPFFTTKVIGKNVGLGLSVAREIARQHGGELVLQAPSEGGCLVSLQLPVTQE